MEKKVYTIEFFLDVASQFIVPFVTFYAIYLGFSNIFIGIFNAMLSVSYVLTFFISLFLINSQIIKRVFSISLLIWGISFVMLYYSFSETLFLISIFLRTISSSIISACYTWLISKIFRKNTFEKISNLSIIYTSITLFATIFSGILIKEYGYFQFIFYIPLIFSIFSIIVLEKIKIVDKDKNYSVNKNPLDYIKGNILQNFIDKKLKNYAISLFTFYFSVGIASSFFPVFLKKVLGLSEFEWALITCVEMISFLLFFSAIKNVKKTFSILTLFGVSTFIISLIPLVWIVSKNLIVIILFSFFSGIAWQLFSILHLTYVSKNFGIINKISFLNIFIGLGLMLGNLIGGIISEINLEYVFYISFVFRFFSSYLFTSFISRRTISISDIYKNVFISLDFFAYLLKEFAIQFKSLAPYNHKKDTHKS
ncbi:MAG: MFS transporter [Candidatus Aenigmatarchaeota archaeon]